MKIYINTYIFKSIWTFNKSVLLSVSLEKVLYDRINALFPCEDRSIDNKLRCRWYFERIINTCEALYLAHS